MKSICNDTYKKCQTTKSYLQIMFALSSVFLLIIIQSVYGVGILIFGVPILILYGFEYLDIIGLLLPSSMTISTLQIFKNRTVRSNELKHLPLAIFGVSIGLAVAARIDTTEFMPAIVGALMLSAAFFRISTLTKKYMEYYFEKHQSTFHILNAILHGFTNLGGVLLTVYSSSVHNGKIPIVYCTALFYMVYAASQMIIIFLLGQGEIFKAGLIYVPITALLYTTLGQKTFRLVSQKKFDILTTYFFFFSGCILLYGYMNS